MHREKRKEELDPVAGTQEGRRGPGPILRLPARTRTGQEGATDRGLTQRTGGETQLRLKAR